MAEPTRRRRTSKAFAAPSSGKSSRKTDKRTLLVLGIVPGLLFLTHLTFGANQPIAALWFSTLLATALCVALVIPQARIGLFDLKPAFVPLALFVTVIGVALWSLTPWTPGGPHPIWAWAGVSPGASTVNTSATVQEIIKLLGLACIFVVGCLQSARKDRGKSTLDVLLVLGAVYAGVSLLLFLSGKQIMGGGRLSGGFLSANSGATVFGVLTVIGLGNLLRQWRQAAGLGIARQLSQVSTALAFVLLFAACLLLTASRMGVVATAVAASVLLVWETFEAKGQRLPILISGLVLFVVAGVLMLGSNDLLWQRLDKVDGDLVVRGAIFSAHWKAFLASPLFGYGLGSFSDVNSQIMTAENYGNLWSIRATHNVYLQWLEEAGIVGAAPMFILIGVVLAVGVWRTTQLRSGQTLLRALVVGSLVVLIHGTTDYGLQVPSIAAFWAFLLGLSFAFGQRRN